MPELRGRQGPKYQAIVDAIVDAVESGDLAPGAKLPPQRNLAYDLGVTLGTVTRAYQELERSGLARGEVGRGTFITDKCAMPPGQRPANGNNGQLDQNIVALRTSVDTVPSPYNALYGTDFMGSEGLELASNYPVTNGVGALTQQAVARVNHEAVWDAVSRYQAHNGLAPHLDAGAQWLNSLGVEAHPGDILITPGAQAATQTTFMALTKPGDLILAEMLSWPGVKATAAPLGLRRSFRHQLSRPQSPGCPGSLDSKTKTATASRPTGTSVQPTKKDGPA